MTKVLKLLGGGRLAAVWVVVLVAAIAALSVATVSAESPPNPPARFVGSVLVDGQAATAGTIIEARIGNTTCGSSTVFMASGEARYALDSPALDPGATPNCGVDGAAVSFFVGGKKANETGSWKNYQLNILNLTVTTPTPSPSASGTPGAGSATPKPPTTGTTPVDSTTDGTAAWLFAVLGLAAITLGVGGATVARRAR